MLSVVAVNYAAYDYAAYENSPEAKAVAWVVFIIATRMYHWAQVARGRALWRDPLAPASAWVDEKTGGASAIAKGTTQQLLQHSGSNNNK